MSGISWIRTLTVVSVASLLASTAVAQDDRPKDSPRDSHAALFDQLDENKDGSLAADEAPEEHRRLFNRLLRQSDKNGDGKLSRDEFVAGLSEDREDGPPDRAEGRRGRPEGQPDRPRRERREGRPDRPREDGGDQGDRPGPDRRRGDGPDAGPGDRPFGRPGPGPGGRGGDRPDGAQEGRFGGRPGQGMIGIALVRVLDKNSDGKLDAEEIAAATEALKKLDTNGDGDITREELAPQIRGGRAPGNRPRGPDEGGQPGRPEFNPENVYRRLMNGDKNSDGKLQKDELPERLQERFDELDTSKDGTLDESEIRAGFERMRNQRAGGRPEGRPDDGRPDRPRRRPGPPEERSEGEKPADDKPAE